DPDRVDPAAQRLELVVAVRERHDAALAQHDVEVELAAQALVEPERVVVKRGALGPVVVRACGLRVAAAIAAAEPALVEYSDIADAVLFRKVIRRREAMSAGTDNHDIVRCARIGVAPGGSPAA